ncbi:hypothetical protein PybrP1_008420 [[Pythium] brassicae (nom. inval.)]|nr:hypothetical protein PybrP1_008420 [[Pythium] brassicae (nom. inval.)]
MDGLMSVAGSAAARVAEVVLFAEFDIDKGSTLRESFPTALPHYSPEFFADVMLPEGAHNRTADSTVFFLNRKRAPQSVVRGTVDADAAADETDPLKEFMYCLSVVHTTHDTSARRGAKVKAVAMCSRHKFCFAFKDVLSVAAGKLAAAKDEAGASQVLRELFETVNAVDTSGARALTDVERRLLKRTVSSSSGRRGAAATHAAGDDALFFRTHATWGETQIPLQFKLSSTDDQYDDGLLRKLLLRFGEQTMLLYNAVLTGARVIVLGYNQAAGDVCNYVLAMSSLVCPPLFGLLPRQYPYANLTDLDFLSTPGFIAGVTNPMFKSKREWWDVLCDISSGDVLLAAPAERDEYESADRNFVLEVLDGINAGYDEEWIRCMFEEYTRKNVVDIALGEANNVDMDTQVKRIAANNKRITKWARTDSYKLLTDARQHATAPLTAGASSVVHVEKTGIDLKRHIRSLQGDTVVLDDGHVERVYQDFVSLLHAEEELQEFLSYLPLLRGGLHTVAQGIFYPSISVKYNTVLLLQRLESFPSTATSLRLLNAFVLMSYQRIHDIVQPDVRG